MQVTREIINLLQVVALTLEVTLSPSDPGNRRWYHAPTQSPIIEIWLRLRGRWYGFDHLLEDLGISSHFPMPMHCDDQASNFIAGYSTFHECTKHIEIDCHYIRDKVMSRVIFTPHVTSSHQLADVLTKSLAGISYDTTCTKLGMFDL